MSPVPVHDCFKKLNKRGKIMKVYTFSWKIFIMFLVLVLMGACSSVIDNVIGGAFKGGKDTEESQSEIEGKKASVSVDSSQAIIGTWINKEYNGDKRSAKLVYTANSDGTISYVVYDSTDGSGNKYEGTVTYKEQWADSQGRLCGKSIVKLFGGMSWETLDRISADGKTLEVQSGVAEINPKGPRYSIYYRE